MSNYNQHQEVVNDLMNRMNDKRSLHNIDHLADLSSDQLDALNKQIDVMNRQHNLAMEDSAAATKHANKSMIFKYHINPNRFRRIANCISSAITEIVSAMMLNIFALRLFFFAVSHIL